ncbi:MAG TPA: hypothetical protein VN436_11830 [Holophaga sp.]|nr:hypothetical protein [Holophaga sp.]
MQQSRPSIHHQRRWYYALWVGLLGLSLAAKVLWETPSRTGVAYLAVHLAVQDLPSGSQAQAWAGPRAQWEGAAWQGLGSVVGATVESGEVSIPRIPLPVGYRRWVRGDVIPRRTSDFVVCRVLPPSGQPRYLAFPLKEDWRSGVLRPGAHLALDLGCRWRDLATDPAGAVPVALKP